jgi:predicted small metal-binding protein
MERCPETGTRKTMGCGRLKVACDDGFEVVSKDQKELVSLVQWHGKHAHSKDFSHEEVLKMAKHP